MKNTYKLFLEIFLRIFLNFILSRDEFFSGGFVGGRLGPKKPTGGKVDPQFRASKKIDKRGRFQHHNSDKHYRRNNKKPYIMDNVNNMFNKFH